MINLRPGPALFLVHAVTAVAAAGCAQPEGLRIDVTLGDFGMRALTLKVAVGALPGGFARRVPENPGGATVTTEDVDGDGLLELVAAFPGPFPSGTLSFRVDTGNRDDLDMTARALAYDAT